MQPTASYQALKKELSLAGVFAIATGTTLSAGFFLLPSLAARAAGPALVLAYLVAGLLLIPAMLSAVELATAMPRSGGAYYFLDRSLGPLAGTVGGMGTWLALMLKVAFALVGMGAYVALFLPDGTPKWIYLAIAVALALFFGGLNLLGAKKTGGAQTVLVAGLLTILSAFIIFGAPNVDVTNFSPLFAGEGGEDPGAFLGTVGLVFISYVGVTKVASVAEEVQDPDKNLPRGVFLALSVAVLVYVLGLTVMVGVVGVERLAADPGRGGLPDLTPVATAASLFSSSWGGIASKAVAIAALLAFSSVVNAGIMSASRYPLAMARDNLVPPIFAKVSQRGAPTWGVLVTVSLIIGFVFVDPMKIAKLASAFQLLMFALLCLAVIVMRESHIQSYDPGYRTPFYPWVQLVGLVAPFILISQMGWMPALFSASLMILGVAWFRYYASDRVDRHGAIYHVFERLGRQRFAGLDTELRGILKEKGLRDADPFDEVVALARVINSPSGESFASLADRAAKHLAGDCGVDHDALLNGFMEGTRMGATPVTSGVALPHLRVPGIDLPRMCIVRSQDGVEIGGADAFGKPRAPESVAAIFFLVSPESDPTQHLRMLAKLAGSVEKDNFMDRWLAARNGQELKEILFQDDAFANMTLRRSGPASGLVGQQIMHINLPESCLVVIIRRDGEFVVPRGGTKLCLGDALTIIGDPPGIAEVRERFGLALPAAARPTAPEPAGIPDVVSQELPSVPACAHTE